MFDFQKCMVNSGTIIFTAFIREHDPDAAAFEYFLYLCTLYRNLVRADYTLLRLPWYVRSLTTNKEMFSVPLHCYSTTMKCVINTTWWLHNISVLEALLNHEEGKWFIMYPPRRQRGFSVLYFILCHEQHTIFHLQCNKMESEMG